MSTTVELDGIEGVLHSLEEAARKPNIESEDFSEIFGREKWEASRNE